MIGFGTAKERSATVPWRRRADTVFFHKDLRRFLSGELDYFLKSVMFAAVPVAQRDSNTRRRRNHAKNLVR